jgi:hypothetical protein
VGLPKSLLAASATFRSPPAVQRANSPSATTLSVASTVGKDPQTNNSRRHGAAVMHQLQQDFPIRYGAFSPILMI